MVSKDLFLDVHHALSVWRWNVLHWFRQFLRNYAPFDVARRLHYEVYTVPYALIYGDTPIISRYRWFTKTNPAGVHWNDHWKLVGHNG